MTQPNSSNTLALGIEPMVRGYPVIVDDAFNATVEASAAGGEGTQNYFDSLNRTSDFWNLIATGTITFAPGVDPDGRAVVMASDGNVDLRVQAVPVAAMPPSHQIGVITVTTREVGTQVSRMMTGAIVVKNNPSALVIDEPVFNELLPTIYESTVAVLTELAGQFAQASQVESPHVEAETLTSKALFSASQKAIGATATLIEYGLGFTAVTWVGTLGEALGLGVLMAIPEIVEYLGHTMQHSVVIDNLASADVAWELTTVHGDSTVDQPADPIPGQRSMPDPLQVTETLRLSSQLHLLHINATRESTIGYVLRLVPQDGSPTGQVLVSIPLAKDNVIWVGETEDPAMTVWDQHFSGSDHPLTTTAAVGNYDITVTLNQLDGTHDDAHFYCSSVVISPR